MFHKISNNNDLIIILAFCVLFYLFLTKKGILSKIFENDFSVFLGKYAFSIFLIHLYVLALLEKCLWKTNPAFVISHPIINVILAIVLMILSGVIVYHLIEKPVSMYLKKSLNNY